MNTYNMFLSEALTNMHVGSGEIHYDIVDNKIQRNPVTSIPVIHSSGLKGALRDYYSSIEKNKSVIDNLFGKESNAVGADKSVPGHLIVFEANLIFLPLRSSQKVFYYATSPSALMDFFNFLKAFCLKSYDYSPIERWIEKQPLNDNTPYVTFDGKGAEIEDYSSLAKGLVDDKVKKIFRELFKLNLDDVVLFSDNFFKVICEDSIPVITRNQLDDEGISKNLFYEEVLPRKSKLYFMLGEENEMLGNDYKSFTTAIANQDTILQFGGNYSIGYGFSKIENIA